MTDEAVPSRYWMLTDSFVQDPYPVLDRLRREQPVTRLQMPNGVPTWVVTRYADCRAAAADTKRFRRDVVEFFELVSKHSGEQIEVPVEETRHPANIDPPEHTRLRRAISFAFTPRRVENLRPRITEMADELLDKLAGKSKADLVPALANPLPVIAIAELMGVPKDMWPDFLRWSMMIKKEAATDSIAVYQQGVAEVSAYLRGLVKTKHDTRGEDLLSALVHAPEDKRLSDDEVVAMGFALMTGGNDTTAAQTSGVIAALLAHDEQRAELMAEPGRWPQVIDELIRFANPIMSLLYRITTEEVELGGVTIPKGEIVLLNALSANYDPEQFPDPQRLDLNRPKPQQLSFGHGIHYCSGSHLAKAITEIAVSRLFERFPDVRLLVQPAELRYEQSVALHPLMSVPVRLR